MKDMRNLAAAAAACLFLASCGDDPQDTSIAGRWTSCANLTSQSARVTIEYAGNAFTASSALHEGNTTCAGTASHVTTATGTFATGVTSLGDGKISVDYTLATVVRTYNTAGAATAANTATRCGLTNWAASVQQTITGLAGCDELTPLYPTTTTAGSVLYSRYSRSGSQLLTDHPVNWDGLLFQPASSARLAGVYTFEPY